MSLVSNFFRDPFFEDWWNLDPFSNRTRAVQGQTGQQGQERSQLWSPRVDIRETDKELIIHADLPGVKKEDVHLEIQNDVLTLSGERSEEKKETNERYHRMERTFGKFQRRMTLPAGTDPNNVGATFNNGVLELRIQKLPQAQPQKITIQ